MGDDLNGLDTKINDRGFFERILREFKETLAERNKRLDERFAGQKDAITKAEQRLDVILAGFPDEYSRKVEIERLRETLQTTASVLAEKVTDTAVALTAAQDKVVERQDARILALEKFQSKLLGLALSAPFVTGIVVYFITRNR